MSSSRRGPSSSGDESIAITGGLVVTAAGSSHCDLLISGERIVALGENLQRKASRSLDARGCYVIPGGIDPHTHLQYRVGANAETADDFRSGTRAAAFGGTTTVFDFAKRASGSSLADSCLARENEIADSALIDYAFHATLTADGLDGDPNEEVAALRDIGVGSIKIFLAYPGRMMIDDFLALDLMRAAAAEKIIIAVHAENGHLVQAATSRLLEQGKSAPRFHSDAHPEEAEEEAIERSISLARVAGCRLYIVHVSSASGAAAIQRARSVDYNIAGETCPQYLFRALEDYGDSDKEAVRHICSPPIRQRINQDHLWTALRTGALSTVGTDHAPFHIGKTTPLHQSRRQGLNDFSKTPNGVPGIEERLSLLFTYGVLAGRLSLERFVDCTSTSAARILGIYPQKGTLAIGSDADIVVWDPQPRYHLSRETHHSAVDYNLYEGLEVTGRPRYVLSRGELIVADAECTASPGRGRRIRAGALAAAEPPLTSGRT
jgi:dihydropyrimidinase